MPSPKISNFSSSALSPQPSALVWAEINLNQLRQNLKIIRSRLKTRQVEVLAVVKADAYGHGMKAVAETLAREGVRFFGVASLDEALELRTICPKVRILVLGGLHKGQAPHFVKAQLTPTLFSLEDVSHLEKALKNQSAPFPVHVKIDTGMGRLGVWHKETISFFKQLKKNKTITVEGVYTHFARADHADKNFTEEQLAIFEDLIKEIKRLGIAPKYFHAANSIGLVRFRHSHLNLVRPGIILYGINPMPSEKLPAGIRPILALKTFISFLKDVEKGRSISYGGTYVAPHPTRIATIPVGYSHGYRVAFSNKAFVVVRGRKCPVVGRVTMDQTLVDVGELSAVRRWDEVTLIGKEGKNEVQAEDLANLIGSIPYEIVCAIHSRIPRIYKGLH